MRPLSVVRGCINQTHSLLKNGSLFDFGLARPRWGRDPCPAIGTLTVWTVVLSALPKYCPLIQTTEKRPNTMRVRTSLIVYLICASLPVFLPSHATAQTFSNLYNFTSATVGANPYSNLVLTNGTLFGTAADGGSSGNGTVFKVRTDGTGFTILHTFTGGSDGATPYAGLILSGNTLYGAAWQGGTAGFGTVFKVSTTGTGFSTLHTFTALSGFFNTNTDGSDPFAGVVLSSNTLYGTAVEGGKYGFGSIFRVNTNGTAFTNLHSFPGGTEGTSPYGGLTIDGTTLYGTTANGSGTFGTVFSLNTDGTGFRNLYIFSGTDGEDPYGTLTLSGSTLYGTTRSGGTFGTGTAFKINTDGNGFMVLHNFSHASNSGTNTDGVAPSAQLFLTNNVLYGTTYSGGSVGNGAVFAVTTNGASFANLHNFTQTSGSSSTNSDGSGPTGALFLSDNVFYGTAQYGGNSGSGIVFSLSLSTPSLRPSFSGASFTLTWPASALGFTLQSTTNLASPSWSSNSPAPTIVNGQNTITNTVLTSEKYYRLVQ